MTEAKQRETYKSASAAVLGLLLASIVLFPAAVGILKPPLYYALAQRLYLGSFFVGSVFLAIAYYLAAWTHHKPPHISGSLGLFAALFCLGSFVWFFFGNVMQDQTAPPEVTSLIGDKISVEQGEPVTFIAEGTDQSGDSLRWIWSVKPSGSGSLGRRLSSHLRTAAWHVPNNARPMNYEIEVIATDGNSSSKPQTLIIKVEEKCDG